MFPVTSRQCLQSPELCSDVEPEVDDVPVLHHVLAPLQPVLPGLLGRDLAAECYEVVVSDDLGADEALLDVGVDGAGGAGGRGAAAEGPGAALVLAGRKEAHEPE